MANWDIKSEEWNNAGMNYYSKFEPGFLQSIFYMKTIKEFDFDSIKRISPDCYCDGDIAFHDSVSDIPIINGAIRLDMAVIVGCREGRCHAEINGYPLVLSTGEILIIKPNDSVSELTVSPDFNGSVLCLSLGILAECVSNRYLWRKIFQLKESPVISVTEQSRRMFELYGEIISSKTKIIPNEFTREIIYATVRSALNEIADNIRPGMLSEDSNLTQGELLFKKFMELISHKRIKPRSVEWYARQLCVTPKYLSVVCKAQTGKRTLDIINEFVFTDIRNQLKNTDKSIKEITHYLEFPSMSFFGKYVRNRIGMSPTRYRNALISGEI